jgi:hypothetical protein
MAASHPPPGWLHRRRRVSLSRVRCFLAVNAASSRARPQPWLLGVVSSRTRCSPPLGWLANRRIRCRLVRLRGVFAKFGPFRRTVARGSPLLPEDADDRKIVAFLVAREPRALELVYDRWAPLTYALALRIVHDAAQAEKVVLEGYLTLWRHPELALLHYDSIRAYLCAVISCDARLRHLTSRPIQGVSRNEATSVQEVKRPIAQPSRRLD